MKQVYMILTSTADEHYGETDTDFLASSVSAIIEAVYDMIKPGCFYRSMFRNISSILSVDYSIDDNLIKIQYEDNSGNVLTKLWTTRIYSVY